MVTSETIGNMTRPPYRSVRAPTGMRPSEPTMTGTATSRATSDSLRAPSVPVSRNSGPSGLSSAHAQKLTAKPRVASASISHGDRTAPVVPAVAGGCVMSVPPDGAWSGIAADPGSPHRNQQPRPGSAGEVLDSKSPTGAALERGRPPHGVVRGDHQVRH